MVITVGTGKWLLLLVDPGYVVLHGDPLGEPLRTDGAAKGPQLLVHPHHVLVHVLLARAPVLATLIGARIWLDLRTTDKF